MTGELPVDRPPTIELEWPDHREQLVFDTTLAKLPVLPLDELTTTLGDLRHFEREVSDLRAQLHVVIDAIDHVLADRRVAGTAG